MADDIYASDEARAVATRSARRQVPSDTRIPTGRDSLASILAHLTRIQRAVEEHGDEFLNVEGAELAALDDRIGELADELTK